MIAFRSVVGWMLFLVPVLTFNATAHGQTCIMYYIQGGGYAPDPQTACWGTAAYLDSYYAQSLPAGYSLIFTPGIATPTSCGNGTETAYGPTAGYPSTSPWVTGLAHINIPGACPTYWVRSAFPANSECSTCNKVGEPINPAVGNVYSVEDDLVPPVGSGIAFRRFYSSAESRGGDFAPGWRHSYDRALVPLMTYAILASYSSGDSTYSSLYSTPGDACVAGFTEVQPRIPAWQGATAQWAGLQCTIKQQGITIGTLQMFTSGAVQSSQYPFEVDAVRDDGQIIRFPVSNGAPMALPGNGLTLTISSAGFTVTDNQDNVETYNSSGVLQSIKTRAGVVQTVSHDSSGRLQGVVDSFGHSLTLTYNAQGQLSAVSQQ